MQFLKTLLQRLKESTRSNYTLHKVESSERITRYLLNKSGRFSPESRRVKYAAFLPAKNGETSVYRTSSLDDSIVWNIGKQYVADPQSKEIKARGDLKALHVLKLGLEIEPTKLPHPRHANIINWPKEKDEQKMLAIELANQSLLLFPPDTSA